jgi:hypothetical protein
MRNFLIVSGAALAASMLVTAASAAAPAAPAAPAAAAAPAPAAATTLGTKFIQVDGYRYGGSLVVGADKNLDALRVLIKAAEGTGMVRLGLEARNFLGLGDTTPALRINGTGTYNGQKARVIMDWDYRYPGVRLHVQSPEGKTQQITVVRDTLAWDEKTPGVWGGAAQTSAVDRLVLAYLMPTAVVIAGRDAADVMKLSRDERGRNVLTIPVPKLGQNVNLVATMNAEGHPIRTQITLGGKVYTGEFDDFFNDRMDYVMSFPHSISLKVDGKPLMELELEWHHLNPYVIFPVPKEVAAK